jgi:hypothetical protein
MIDVLVAGLTATHDSPRTQLGSLYRYNDPTYGSQTYRYVQNGNAGAAAIGQVAVQKASATTNISDIGGAAAPVARVLGVHISAMPASYYGWVLCQGLGLVQSNGTTTANTAQKTAASGQVTDGVIGTDELPIFAMAANAVAGSTSVMRINAT